MRKTAMLYSRARDAVSVAHRYIRDATMRSEVNTRLLFPTAIHQGTTFSTHDRYPRLFSAVQKLLIDAPSPRILSFGCSAGEEVLSLQEYCPTALVTGAELNRSKLRACRRLPPDAGRRFIMSSHDAIAGNGPYDAIFCMAVLTRRAHYVENRRISNIARLYPFARFAEELDFLVGQLSETGLLIVEHSLYRVEDVAGLPVDPLIGPATYLAKGPRFDPSGERLHPQPIISRIFRKRSA